MSGKLSSLYEDSSSGPATPVRPNPPARTTAANSTKKPFQSPLKTPLRSPQPQSPIVKQYKATSALLVRIFTSNVLFWFVSITLPIFVALSVARFAPYVKTGFRRCDKNVDVPFKHHCFPKDSEEAGLVSVGKIIHRIVRSQLYKTNTIEDLMKNVKVFATENNKPVPDDNTILKATNYVADVSIYDGKIIYKMTEKVEMILLTIFVVLTSIIFFTCLICRYRHSQ